MFVEPGHKEGRALLADVLEQLGVGCENGIRHDRAGPARPGGHGL
nr:hypothetical protein [Pseudofrankia asymbiotica]